MVTTLCIVACALATGQTTEWQLQPRLSRGQELVYSGSFVEEALNGSASMQRTYKVDTHVLVIESRADKTELAVLTVITSKSLQTLVEPGRSASLPFSVRLEVITMDRLGRVLSPQAPNLIVPLDGPPTVEYGMFPELPKPRVGPRASWDVTEVGRTPRSWHADMTETVNNILCVRLAGLQQSDDWDAPRADQSSWQRVDTLWVSSQSGITCRYEREIKRRDPARQTPTHRTLMRCELDGGLTYQGQLLDDRLKEIQQARGFARDAEAWLHEPQQHKVALETILKKMKRHNDTEAPTPYRKAILQVQKRIEAALRGEAIPNPEPDRPKEKAPPASIGQRIPDFICTDLLSRQTLRLQKVLGKPVVVAFYSPTTETAKPVLQLGRALTNRHPNGLTVLPMAITDDLELVRQQHAEMKLAFSIHDGKGLLHVFGVDALPRIVVLDEQGVVRHAWTGWGLHTPAEVSARIQEMIPR